MTLDPAIGWMLALSLSLLFGAAAAHKLRDLGRFRSVLTGYRLLPAGLEAPAAVMVIGAEVLSAVALLVPSWRTLGAGLAIVLLLGYAAALGVNLLRGRVRIDCGCLGLDRSERIGWWMVIRNLFLAAAAAVAAVPPAARGLGALDVVTVTGTVITASLLFSAAARLAATPGRREGLS